MHKKFKITTDSKHNKPIAENHLAREFSARHANERWTSDITYIPTQEGWLYLAVVMDLYSRQIERRHSSLGYLSPIQYEMQTA